MMVGGFLLKVKQVLELSEFSAPSGPAEHLRFFGHQADGSTAVILYDVKTSKCHFMTLVSEEFQLKTSQMPTTFKNRSWA